MRALLTLAALALLACAGDGDRMPMAGSLPAGAPGVASTADESPAGVSSATGTEQTGTEQASTEQAGTERTSTAQTGTATAPGAVPADGRAGQAAPSAGPAFDVGRAWEHLRRQVAFGPRPAGSPALDATRQYLLQQLRAAGIAVREQAFDAETPVGRLRMVNLIATLPGRRTDRIAIASHYDTKRFSQFRFVGASDGASSTAVLLELGRVLAGRTHEHTIELLFLDGEEATLPEWQGTDNTYGSRHYVDAARVDGSLAGLKALVLLDMIGDRDLNIRRESYSTPWLTDIIWSSAERLGHGAHFLPQQLALEDDHVPFLRAGVPAVDIIDFDYPAWHTARDDLDQVSARSLGIVADVVLDALPRIDQQLTQPTRNR